MQYTKLSTLNRKFNPMQAEVGSVEDQIMEATARTVAGLRVNAMVAVRCAHHLWEKPFDDLDYDQKTIRSLIEAVCVVTGLDTPAERSITRCSHERGHYSNRHLSQHKAHRWADCRSRW
jgi:hypothetical protein